MKRRTMVVAEIGENHGGDWSLARDMVVAAAESGADVVKFQSYLGSEVADDDPEKEWFEKVELPDEVHHELKKLAEERGVEFLSSCFSLDRAKFLVEDLGLRKVKVASSEMLNSGLLRYLDRRVETVFLSTGLATLAEIREAVRYLDNVDRLYILQCTAQYPCPFERANLAAIGELRRAFPKHGVGFSDHTIGILASVVAVALGAEVVEKHFTLDKSLPGTDHVLSATPAELEQMVAMIRDVERLLGSAEKQPTHAERKIRDFVRSRFPKSP